MYLDPSVSINCKYKIMNNIRLDPLTTIKKLLLQIGYFIPRLIKHVHTKG